MRLQQTLKLLLTSILLVSMIPLGVFAEAGAISPFTDVPDNHWGLQHIYKMEHRGVITGYGNGLFKPDKTVSQLEAVVMVVRAMGLEEESKTINTSVVDAWELDLPTSWNAASYVAMAINKGLIDKDDFHPAQNATRAWIAMLMIKMIGLEDEVDPNAKTTFYDDQYILSWTKGYIALAVEKGIITGFYDANGHLKFAPNTNVTRVQLAAMLGRTDTFLQNVDGQLPLGKILSLAGQQITLKDEEGEERTYSLIDQVLIYNKEGKKKGISDLYAELVIRYAINDDNRIDYIELVDSTSWTEKQMEITGTIAQLVFTEDHLITIKDQNEKLVIYPYDLSLSVTNLHIGDEVSLTLNSDNVITHLEVKGKASSGSFEGTIYSLDLETMILALKNNGQYEVYPLSEEVYVEYDGVRFPSVKDLQKGDQVEVTIVNDQVKNIRVINAFQQETLNGKIIVLSSTDQVVTVRLGDGTLKAYEMAEEATLSIKGKENAIFEDLKVDDAVQFTVLNGVITSLQVTNREIVNEITGEVKSIDTVNGYITLENSAGELKTFTIDSYAKVDYDAELDAIEIGMKITLQLRDNVVYAISTNTFVEATLVAIDDFKTFITVQTKAGKREVYRLSNVVDINIIDVASPEVSDLKEGQSFILQFDQDVVTRMDIMLTKTTTLTDINKSRNKITVKQDDGGISYRLYSFTKLTIPNISDPKIGDLIEGDGVKLSFSGNNLIGVEVIPPVFGRIKTLETYRDKMIISTRDGERTIDLDKTVSIYNSNGTKMSMDKLEVNDYIQLIELDEELIITQAKQATGTLIVANGDQGKLYMKADDGEYLIYTLSDRVRVWKGNTEYYLGDLQPEDMLILYLFNEEVEAITIK